MKPDFYDCIELFYLKDAPQKNEMRRKTADSSSLFGS